MNDIATKANTKLKIAIIISISLVVGLLMLYAFYRYTASSDATGTQTATIGTRYLQMSGQINDIVSVPIELTLTNAGTKSLVAATAVMRIPDASRIAFTSVTNSAIGQCNVLEEIDSKIVTVDGGQYLIVTSASKSSGIWTADNTKCLFTVNFKLEAQAVQGDKLEVVQGVLDGTTTWVNSAIDEDGGNIAIVIGNQSVTNFVTLGGSGASCTETSQCAIGLICEGNDGAKTCQPGQGPGESCDAENVCGNGYICSDQSVCIPNVCSATNSLGCVTPTPLPTSTPTPTPIPPSDGAAPVCTDDNCTPKPYYVLLDDEANPPNTFQLRYYPEQEVDTGVPRVLYSLAVNNLESENITSSDFVRTTDSYYQLADPFPYNLFKIKIQKEISRPFGAYVISPSLSSRWTVTQASVSGVDYVVYTRRGYVQPTPTTTTSPMPTPTGFNLYLDPARTDPSRDGVVVKLQTWVRQGVRRGENFTVRVVASPLNNSELVHLQTLKVPLQYALPGDSKDIILTSITNTRNPDCGGFVIDYPEPTTNVATLSSFYLKASARDTRPKQLVPDTCVAELSFTVSTTAEPGSSTLKLLSVSEAASMNNGSGVPEIETQVPLAGTYALGYHLSLISPPAPSVTPTTGHPKIGIQYDPSNKSKTFRIDTSRPVPSNPPDLAINSFAQGGFRVIREQPEACGPLALQATIRNISGTDVPAFSVTINGEKVDVPSGLVAQTSVDVKASVVYFNDDGINTIFVDSEDVIIESREDNNYQEKKLVFADIPNNECPRPTGRPTVTPGPTDPATPTPEYVIDMSKVNVKLVVKVQGIQSSTFSSQYSRLKFGVAIGGGSLNDNTDYTYSTFTHRGEGVYEGMVIFDPKVIKSATNYRIIVKGPKHLAKRFCVANPTGGYAYFCPPNASSISLGTGLNEFDFSAVQLTAGDLPLGGAQDGVVDSSDLTFIRDNLGVKGAEIIKIGDLNFDGIIDTQDYSMIINNLVNNEDEN